jgi:hypothetical protein
VEGRRIGVVCWKAAQEALYGGDGLRGIREVELLQFRRCVKLVEIW